MVILVALVPLFAACGGSGYRYFGDLAIGRDGAGGAADMVGTARDLAGADLAGPDLHAAADMNLNCFPKVNEIMTGTSNGARDEFVEVYNPCAAAIDLDGWRLAYRSAGNNNGGNDSVLFNWMQTSIPARGYLVYGGQAFTGRSDGALVIGLAATGGAVGIRDPAERIVDSTSYDTLDLANDFTESRPAANPPLDRSIGRLPDGTDRDDNQRDFPILTAPTPGSANR